VSSVVHRYENKVLRGIMPVREDLEEELEYHMNVYQHVVMSSWEAKHGMGGIDIVHRNGV